MKNYGIANKLLNTFSQITGSELGFVCGDDHIVIVVNNHSCPHHNVDFVVRITTFFSSFTILIVFFQFY